MTLFDSQLKASFYTEGVQIFMVYLVWPILYGTRVVNPKLDKSGRAENLSGLGRAGQVRISTGLFRRKIFEKQGEFFMVAHERLTSHVLHEETPSKT